MHLNTITWAIAFSALPPLVHSVPSSNLDYSPYSRSSRQGIRGADAITAARIDIGHANAATHEGDYYVASAAQLGRPGEAIVTDDKTPTSFFIKSGQLYAYVNQTSVLHVNVVETTVAARTSHEKQAQLGGTEQPLNRFKKVVLGHKKQGIEGEFFWVDSALHFRGRGSDAPKNTPGQRGQDTLSNAGLWWACEYREMPGGRKGRAIYMDFGPSDYNFRKQPTGCESWTFHAMGTPENGY